MQAVRRIRKLVQKAHGAHVPRALWIAAAVIALPLQASGAPSDAPPPLPRPRPAEAPPRTAPHEAAPAELATTRPDARLGSPDAGGFYVPVACRVGVAC